ncbi:MAG TPA: BlaI/MecI/CopY family transcriptional regulator [Candidatus Acidoferrales bacterium]|nr:BlaI/MecI/CopY family transcriptional regulator [Candidatus Acidoferrales bacterium]
MSPFGHLEERVMDILWTRGASSVHDVVERLDRSLAYTTVMTTMDRLYKKGLLLRQKESRAFVYTPSMTRAEWDRERASALVAGFLAQQNQGREMLVSSFLDAVCEHDAALLDELEKRIRAQRRKVQQRSAK